jgi:hypothetical protein
MGESADGLYEADSGNQASGDGLGTRRDEGPDPVIGAGIALFGIFVMGLAGARGLHYVFDAGVATAVAGAVIFVLFVALSAMKQRRARTESAPQSPP